jgi:micrococcal nuclease
MTQNEYNVEVVKVVDGDTVDVNIELGFGLCLKNERVRIVGIDTPESRTSDSIEKIFGLAAKKRVTELLEKGAKLITIDDKKGEDMRGKFGRVLGDFRIQDGRILTSVLAQEGHCVPYFGGSKDTIKELHLSNRRKLLKEGIVDNDVYESLIV